jgi:hypothetical protein
MIDNRPEAERLLVARLMATAKYHANWRELAEAEHDAAVTALRELAAGRADLLAEVAGLLEGLLVRVTRSSCTAWSVIASIRRGAAQNSGKNVPNVASCTGSGRTGAM